MNMQQPFNKNITTIDSLEFTLTVLGSQNFPLLSQSELRQQVPFSMAIYRMRNSCTSAVHDTCAWKQ